MSKILLIEGVLDLGGTLNYTVEQGGIFPGNLVPRKSLLSSEIFARHHPFLCERKKFAVKGNDFLQKEMIFCKRK
jgi:hypothetical protein